MRAIGDVDVDDVRAGVEVEPEVDLWGGFKVRAWVNGVVRVGCGWWRWALITSLESRMSPFLRKV